MKEKKVQHLAGIEPTTSLLRGMPYTAVLQLPPDVILDQNYDFIGLDCDVLRLRPSPGPRSEPTVVLVGQAPVHHARQASLLSQDLQASGEPWSFFRPPNLNSSR